MALNAYVKPQGQKQGALPGSVTQKGQEGKILVLAAEHEMVAPRDAVSGQAIGKRQHKPFVITKEIAQSSPKLYIALVIDESLLAWELQCWAVRTPEQGVQHDTRPFLARALEPGEARHCGLDRPAWDGGG
jgi:type VI secretion system secreted protein Hcp